MRPRGLSGPLGRGRIRAAWVVALAADFLQIVAFPLFLGGIASPLADVVDFAVAGLLIWLLGWHWAFAPTLIAELVPILDLFPNWSAAVFYVSRGWPRAEEPTAGPPGPRSQPPQTTALPPALPPAQSPPPAAASLPPASSAASAASSAQPQERTDPTVPSPEPSPPDPTTSKDSQGPA